jgi:hypothetical protein
LRVRIEKRENEDEHSCQLRKKMYKKRSMNKRAKYTEERKKRRRIL